MKLKRTEYDEIGETLVRKAKEVEPQLTHDHLIRLFGRVYTRLLKEQRSKDETV